MFTLYRWWDRYRLQFSLALLCLGAAWSLRQTEGANLVELYRWLTLPTQANSVQQEQLLAARTWELQQQLAELELKNQGLQTLLGQPTVKQGQALPTPIIGRGADHWWQQIILGRGSQDGVKVGAVVLSPGGLIGRVTHVADHTSRVLLISDPSSRIGVTISRSRYMGILRGQSGSQAVIEFFEKDPDVRVGDVIVTSSLSSFFPASQVIGKVERLNLSKGTTPQAFVALSAPISDIEWVTVLLNDKTTSSMVSSSR